MINKDFILTRTPHRVSFFGGGSDYPEWYLKNGGVELTPLNRNVPKYISNRLDQIRDDIMNGWIRVGVEIPEWAKQQNQR